MNISNLSLLPLGYMNSESFMALGLPYIGIIVGAIVTILPIIFIFYLCMKMITTRHAEKMAMIDKGCVIPDTPTNPNKGLQRGFLVFGLGLGAIVGVLLVSMYWEAAPAIFIGSILIFGGLGQIVGSLIARRLNKKDEAKKEVTILGQRDIPNE